MTSEHNPYVAAVIDMRNLTEAIDAQLRDFEQGIYPVSPEELVSFARKGLANVICRADGARLVTTLRQSQEEKVTHEDI
jgi:hypothetical protein